MTSRAVSRSSQAAVGANRLGVENPEMCKHWNGEIPLGRKGRVVEIGPVAQTRKVDGGNGMN